MNLCYTESGQIMKRGRKSARLERNIMDTSILNTLAQIAPDLMEEMELRTLILERVAALEPIGRRALADVRLRQGCIWQKEKSARRRKPSSAPDV